MVKSWLQKLTPDLKGAFIGWAVFLILSTVGSMTDEMGGEIFILPFKIALTVGQGVLVAKFASNDNRYTKADYLRLGFYSSLWSILFSVLSNMISVNLIRGVPLGPVPDWGSFVFLAILVGPITIFSVVLTSLGAWLYGKYDGNPPISTLKKVGYGCGCILVVGILIVIVIMIYAFLGKGLTAN
jgi:hypothetical protein